MEAGREEGVVYCCALCDSFFLLIVSHVRLAHYRGKEGSRRYDNRNEKILQQIPRFSMLRCPTCCELVSGKNYADWFQSCGIDDATPLSPCHAVCFGDQAEETTDPPLYCDRQQKPGGKPQYKLASGVGPPGLELDGSRSGRLWKPGLKGAGIDRARSEPLFCTHHKWPYYSC